MKKLFYLVFFAALVIFTFSITSCKDLFDSYELTADVENSESGESTPIVDPSTGGSSGGESAKQVYTITYQNTGDADLTGLPTEYTSDVEIDFLDPITSTYSSFDGWYRDSALTDEVTNRAPAVEKGSTGNIVFYAKWTDTLEVTAGGSSTASPFDTLNNAIAYINEKATQQNINIAWTVLVEGSVTGNTVISELKASSLTIMGKSGSSVDILTCDSGSVITVSTKAIVNIENLQITGGKNTTLGGGIYIKNSDAVVSLGSGFLISNNEATNGGGVYNMGTLAISGSSGIDDGKISSNSASKGAGIYNSASGTVILDGYYEISDNTATSGSGYGGGIYNEGYLVMKNDIYSRETGLIDKNIALVGGGIFNNGSFELSDGSISYNYANSNSEYGGGGIYNGPEGNFTMSGGDIGGNQTTRHGGGVYNSGTMLMYGSAVIGDESADEQATSDDDEYSNYAKLNGGGIYNSGSLTLGLVTTDTSIELSGGIYYNLAGSGGGIYNESGSQCYIYSGTIDYNTALDANGVDGVAGTITNASNLPSDVYIQDNTNP